MTTLAPSLASTGAGSPDAALANLRDVRLPDAVSWWPLAPAWWVIAALLVVALTVALVLLVRRRASPRHAALIELEHLRSAARNTLSPVELATALGVLMRRLLLASDRSDIDVATLHGDAWSARLAAGPAALPPPLARWIAFAPYAGADMLGRPAPDPDALLDASERWIRKPC